MKNDSTTEKTSTAITTTGIWRKILPMTPGTNISGANAAVVVSTANVTGTDISFAPSMAASIGFMPACVFANACSPTIIASSTTMPRVMMNANSVTMLIDNPSEPNSKNAPRNDAGMPNATQNARRISRNNARIKSTSPSPIAAFVTNSEMRWSRISESSRQTATLMTSGTSPCRTSA